jgi:hypothetical protein
VILLTTSVLGFGLSVFNRLGLAVVAPSLVPVDGVVILHHHFFIVCWVTLLVVNSIVRQESECAKKDLLYCGCRLGNNKEFLYP